MNENARRQKYQARRAPIGTGTISLLVIFTILCLTTLALLSLSTAVRNQRISQRSFQLTRGRTAAEGAAAAHIAQIDAVLAELERQYPAGDTPTQQAYYNEAARALEDLDCQVDTERGIVSFTLPINEKNNLITELQLQLPGSGPRYVIIAQTMQPSENWAPEGGGEVWQGG